MPKPNLNLLLVAALVVSQLLLPARLNSSSAESSSQYLPKPHELANVDWDQVSSLDELELASLSAIVVALPSGRILGARDAEVELPLASLTKLMTAVVSLENRLPLDSPVTIASEDNNGIIAKFLNVGDSVSRLKVNVGEVVSYRDLLAASLVASANNAATAVARASKPERGEFVRRMNERAKVLGMPTATFTEVTGLDTENSASALDVAILARYAWRNSTLRELSGSPKYELATQAGRKLVLQHTNALARSQQSFSILASKTGFLDEAGYNIALDLRDRRGREYLMVLMNAPTLTERTNDVRTLARWLESQP